MRNTLAFLWTITKLKLVSLEGEDKEEKFSIQNSDIQTTKLKKQNAGNYKLSFSTEGNNIRSKSYNY